MLKFHGFYSVVLARGLTILLKLLPVTPNDAEADTLTDLVFDDVITEIERLHQGISLFSEQ